MPEQLQEMFGDFCVILCYEVFIFHNGSEYEVSVNNPDTGRDMASASAPKVYDAIKACWQALCG